MLGFRVLPKNLFFDSPAIQKMLDRQTRRALSRFGAFVRTRARSSIKRRKKISQPGSPPSAHAGQIKLIFFAYDPEKKSVVIGPIQFNNRRGNAGAQTLEEGGTVTATTKDGKTTIMNYKPRPFMKPAFDAELAKAAEGYKQ